MSDDLQILSKLANNAVTWVAAGLALLGGAVNYIRSVMRGERAWSLVGFVADLVSSVFVGVCTFAICTGFNLSVEISAGLCAYAGHLGARGIAQILQGVVGNASNRH